MEYDKDFYRHCKVDRNAKGWAVAAEGNPKPIEFPLTGTGTIVSVTIVNPEDAGNNDEDWEPDHDFYDYYREDLDWEEAYEDEQPEDE